MGSNEIIKQNYKSIANAIRSKTGKNGLMTAEEMPSEIESIETGIIPVGTKTITENGEGIDVTEFAVVDVNVEGSGDPLKPLEHSEITNDLFSFTFAQAISLYVIFSILIYTPILFFKFNYIFCVFHRSCPMYDGLLSKTQRCLTCAARHPGQ